MTNSTPNAAPEQWWDTDENNAAFAAVRASRPRDTLAEQAWDDAILSQLTPEEQAAEDAYWEARFQAWLARQGTNELAA